MPQDASWPAKGYQAGTLTDFRARQDALDPEPLVRTSVLTHRRSPELGNASDFVEEFDRDGTSRGDPRDHPGIGSTQIATEEHRSDAYLLFTDVSTIFDVDLPGRPRES